MVTLTHMSSKQRLSAMTMSTSTLGRSLLTPFSEESLSSNTMRLPSRMPFSPRMFIVRSCGSHYPRKTSRRSTTWPPRSNPAFSIRDYVPYCPFDRKVGLQDVLKSERAKNPSLRTQIRIGDKDLMVLTKQYRDPR